MSALKEALEMIIWGARKGCSRRAGRRPAGAVGHRSRWGAGRVVFIGAPATRDRRRPTFRTDPVHVGTTPSGPPDDNGHGRHAPGRRALLTRITNLANSNAATAR